MRKLFFLALIVSSCSSPGVPPEPLLPIPTDAQVEYQRMEFNGFVHFNMNTFTNMEWGYGDESPSSFNPTELDCDQWVTTMKEAGMKGVVITAKHHDGFCLWPSAYTEHSVKNSPWKDGKGDVIKELSDACRKHGMKFGVYLSPWDRNHADYGTPEYIVYFRNQLRELLTNYGDIFEVWFDGANGGDGYYGGANEARKVDKHTYYDWENTHEIIAELQPKAIIFSDAGPGCRWIGNEDGYSYETTWSMLVTDSVYGGMPEYGKKYSMGQPHGTDWVPGEADVSIRPGWYYHPYEDHKVKSLTHLTDIYYKSVGRNATLLLNFPVDARGLIHERDREQVLKLGEKISSDFSDNLLLGAKAVCDKCRGTDYCADQTNSGDDESYWAAADGVMTGTLTYTLKKEERFNRIVLQEQIRLGQRISEFQVEVKQGSEWNSIASGSTVGYKRILSFKPVVASEMRIVVKDARASPTLSNVELYYAAPLLEPPTISRAVNGNITMAIPDEGPVIHYTTDGSTPTPQSPIFSNGLSAPNGETFKAISVHDGKQSEVSVKVMDVGPGKWEVLSAGKDSQNAIDLDEASWWAGDEIIINLNENHQLRGFTYLPTQQRYPTGFVEKYSYYTSLDGKKWSLAAKGEFSNINNNPITQRVKFKSTEARYIKFVADRTADGNPASIAELGVITRS